MSARLNHNASYNLRILSLGVFLLLPLWSVFSQVRVTVDTTAIRIGEEIQYTIEVETDSTSLVLFPEGQSFAPLEVIESYKVDTSFAEAKIRLIKKYGLTQFDSGRYQIPIQRVVINEKPFNTDSIQVEVRDVPVDTLKQKMFDIKPVIEVKNPSFDWTSLLLWILAILALIGIGYYFFRRKKIREERKKQLPPYEEAMVALQQLDASEYLKEDRSKDYYSSLTEIVKRYLDREVDDMALESTSNELIERLMLHKDSGHFDFDVETIRKLDAILKRADLVKFAKMKLEESQARLDRSEIESIINETEEVLPEPTEEELERNEEYLKKLAKRKLRRKWIYATSGFLMVLVLAAIIYGSVTGFDNLKDKVLGNEMRDLAEGRWYKSEYGGPAVIIETPFILKRWNDSLSQNSAVFQEGELRDPLHVTVATMKVNTNGQEINLDLALDNTLSSLEAIGAKNMIVKREEFETDKGIKGLKAYGKFNVQVGENRMMKEKSTYELLIFAQGGGIQSVLIAYRDDGTYAETIKQRIINSVELEVTSEGTQKKS